ncbi:MAG: hypothetical protein ACE5HI_15250 [bacterium]
MRFNKQNENSPQQADGVSLSSFPQSFKRESIRSLTAGCPIEAFGHDTPQKTKQASGN